MNTPTWTLPQQMIREVGTKAADLFDVLLTLAVGGIVRGLTVTRITARFNATIGGNVSNRTIRERRIERN